MLLLSIKRIKARFGDCICRGCINETYRVHLKRKDCRYGYAFRCPRCREEKNIVTGFSAGGKLKTLFRR